MGFSPTYFLPLTKYMEFINKYVNLGQDHIHGYHTWMYCNHLKLLREGRIFSEVMTIKSFEIISSVSEF